MVTPTICLLNFGRQWSLGCKMVDLGHVAQIPLRTDQINTLVKKKKARMLQLQRKIKSMKADDRLARVTVSTVLNACHAHGKFEMFT